jgi:tRNA G18 (ribose-2'-O)-methylase SpoU
MDVFLYAPEQFENLCVTARTLEVFGVSRCYVFDPHRLVRDRYGKSYGQRLRTVSAGAFAKIAWQRVAEPGTFLADFAGRAVATVARPDAASLFTFRFRESDLIVLGPERAGLPENVTSACAAQITIPQRGVTESLNVAVASGIVIAEWQRQAALELLE